jgi:hypothetical protein
MKPWQGFEASLDRSSEAVRGQARKNAFGYGAISARRKGLAKGNRASLFIYAGDGT